MEHRIPSPASNDGSLDAPAVLAALRRMGLLEAGETPPCRPLEGGVSSDIWHIAARRGALCLKRALPRLKVAQHWEAPVDRNAYEWEWFRVVAGICPTAVPPLLGQDPVAGLFAMGYLNPRHFPVWKGLLRDGIAEVETAAAVGTRLVQIQQATAGREDLARRFATDSSFHALRIEPYLLATARVHAEAAPALRELARVTAATRLALVHGDVSPKNLLIGPAGPVFLDAECAWYGDPAFDLAFCLNHLLLKCLWTPAAAESLLACFDALAAACLAGVGWEPAAEFERRAAQLLPGLMLARVDGKSPVEYLQHPGDPPRVRRVALHFLLHPPERLAAVRETWHTEITA